MKCPRCVQVIHRGASPCPHCGFSIADADGRFGSGEIRLRALADTGGLIRSAERERVEQAMEDFSRRFPQLFFAVYTGSDGHGSSLRQFGFWLLNRTAWEDVPVDRPNEAGILLVIDADTRSATLTWGYLLDPFITPEDSYACLCRAHGYWLEARYAEGIVRLMDQLSRLLAKRSGQARRDPSKFARRVGMLQEKGGFARRLREGHRAWSEKRREEMRK